jgi:hypothetical protein
MKMKRVIHGVLAAALALLAAVPADAQQRRPGQGERPQLERQVRQRFQQLVQRELGLDDAGMAALEEVNQAFQEPRRELALRQRELRRRLSSTRTLLSEDEAADVLREVVEVREEETRLIREEQARMLEIMSGPQVVRYYHLREELSDRIRAMRDRRTRAGGTPEALW